MQKKILFNLFLLIKITSFSQEIISINDLNDIKVIDRKYELSTNSTGDATLIVQKDHDLKFTKSGELHIPINIKVKILSNVNAKLFQIFFGEGKVDLTESKTEYALPQWWGANTNDLNDDYNAIRKSINSGSKKIKFSIGEYIVSKEISINNAGITLLGNEGFSSSLPKLKFTSNTVNSTFFHFKYPKDCNVVNLNFTHNQTNLTSIDAKKQTCLKFHCDQIEATKNAYWANLDGIVKNCTFSGFYKCITAYGRNLVIKENLFSSYFIGINIKYDKKFYESKEYYETHLLGFRGYKISDNRFHSGNYTSILVDGFNSENLYGCKITNNIHDTGCSFFKGSLSESIINNNIIHRVYLTPAIQLYNANYLTINDNFIGGEKYNHQEKREFRFPIWAEYGIVFENRAFNNSIIGNQLNNIKKDAILFKKLCSNTIISKNIISNFGLGLDAENTDYKYHNMAYQAYNRNIKGYAAIMIGHYTTDEKNPFMNQFTNNNIALRLDKINYGIWVTKKLDNSTISPNLFNINQTQVTNNNVLYLYDYSN